MEPIILMQTKWGDNPMVPLYLFFGGITGGTFIVAVVCDLLAIRYRHLEPAARIGAYLAVPAMILAGLLIAFHLGKPERGIFFPLFFTNYKSWMVLGGWALGISVLFVMGYAILFFFEIGKATWRRVLGAVGIPVLFWLIVNTALLLSGSQFVPMWSGAYLPGLFVNSGLLTGVAAIGLIYVFAHKRMEADEEAASNIMHSFSYGLIGLELLEVFILYAFFQFLFASSSVVRSFGQFIVPNGGRYAYDYVINGPLAGWFWWGVVVIGLLIPIAISFFSLFVRRWELSLSTTKFALILVGGIVLRFVIVWGGDVSAPLPVPASFFQLPPIGG